MVAIGQTPLTHLTQPCPPQRDGEPPPPPVLDMSRAKEHFMGREKSGLLVEHTHHRSRPQATCRFSNFPACRKTRCGTPRPEALATNDARSVRPRSCESRSLNSTSFSPLASCAQVTTGASARSQAPERSSAMPHVSVRDSEPPCGRVLPHSREECRNEMKSRGSLVSFWGVQRSIY